MLQNLIGIDTATFQSDWRIGYTVREAIANLIPGAEPENVIRLWTTDNNRRRLSEELLATSVTMQYSINMTSTDSAQTIFGQMSFGVQYGTFDVYLSSNAVTNNVPVLESCTSNTITMVSSGSGGGGSKGMSGGTIAGIVIGVLAAVGFISRLVRRSMGQSKFIAPLLRFIRR